MTQMRVLISAPDLSPEKNVSGISSVVATIIDGLSDRVQFFHLKAGRSDKDFLGLAGYFYLLFSLLAFPFKVFFNGVNLFHQNVPLNFKGVIREYLFSTLASACRLPVLVHLHGGDYICKAPSSPILLYMVRSLLRRARKVVVLNAYEVSQIKRLYDADCVVLKNAVNDRFFSMKSVSFTPGKVSFIFLGRIESAKGLNEMVEAFKMLRNEGSTFRFVLCGAGPEEDFFVRRFMEVLGDDFEFMGVVSGEHKRSLIQQADFFLLPSYAEGLPISLLEAMSCGVVPIVSDDESLLHVIKNESNGFVVQKRSAVDLAKTLGRLMVIEQNDYRMISLACRKAVEEHYSVNNYNQYLFRLYQDISAKS